MDFKQRNDFCEKIDTNFSVIAPAGVGKTTAIVSRIIQMAKIEMQTKRPILSQLVAITYTNKAAEEMRMRALQSLLEQNFSADILSSFEQAFFGTIHSFCLNLLKRYTIWTEFSINPEIENDVDYVWLATLREIQTFRDLLPAEISNEFFRLIDFAKIWTVVKSIPVSVSQNFDENKIVLSKPPELSWDKLFAFVPDKRNQEKVNQAKILAKTWKSKFENRESDYLPIPECDFGGEIFKNLWQETFEPLKKWLENVLLIFSVRLSKKTFDFRVQKNCLFYDDIAILTNKILSCPEVKKKRRNDNFRIILDEAQDTDLEQFKCLLSIANRNQNLKNVNIFEEREYFDLKQGCFCMVGDPQQAIYGDRSNVIHYLDIHKRLKDNNSVNAIEFNVTFRCPKNLIESINFVFPEILCKKDETPNQVQFVPLKSCENAIFGSVVRKKIDENEIDCLCDLKFNEKTEAIEKFDETKDAKFLEIKWLANWLKKKNPRDFEIENWSEMAILCPRNDWLSDIHKYFQKESIRSQLNSSNDCYKNYSIYAWATALVTIIVQPNNSFEITGVLREIFGLSDFAIAKFYHEKQNKILEKYDLKEFNHPIDISKKQEIVNCEVSKQLNNLFIIREKVLSESLGLGFQMLLGLTQLEQRLNALGNLPVKKISSVIDFYVSQAVQFEKQGKDWAVFLDYLKSQKNEKIDEQEIDSNSIQLFSCHKSKGLEWKVVLIPFLFRPIIFPNSKYPFLDFKNENVRVIYDKYSKRNTNYERQAEFERLLYVSMTRAKKSLILIDDQKLFGKQSFSMGELLIRQNKNSNTNFWWNDLQNENEKFAKNSYENNIINHKFIEQNFEKTKNICFENDNSKKCENFQNLITIARKNSTNHPIKLVPSEISKNFGENFGEKINFTSDKEYDRDLKSSFENLQFGKLSDHSKMSLKNANLAKNYGIWWHNMIQKFPFSEIKTGYNSSKIEFSNLLKTKFSEFVSVCPIKERGEKELNDFISSNLAIQLINYEIQQEVPIFGSLKIHSENLLKNSSDNLQATDFINESSIHKNYAIEGFIDLLAHDKENVLIIDWKTDVLKDISEFVTKHENQLKIYKTVVSQKFSNLCKIRTIIYSTYFGKIIEF